MQLASDSAALAVDQQGGFVVAWGDEKAYSQPNAVRVRRFGPGGASGGEITVGEGRAARPAVVCDAGGRFVVTWSKGDTVWTRSFASDGSPLGEGRELGKGAAIPMAMAGDGRILAARLEYRNGAHDLFVQALEADGTPRRPEATLPLPSRLVFRDVVAAAPRQPSPTLPGSSACGRRRGKNSLAVALFCSARHSARRMRCMRRW